MERYYSANTYFKEIFKEKVYKISLDGGMNCPNRDASKNGGCIFCSMGGSGDFAAKLNTTIKDQLSTAIELIKSKGAKKYIAYFQSYTNTYANIDYLRKIFYEAISDERVVALSIATRPDSISDECLELLKELNKIKKVFIELGLQTSNDETAKLINRGYKSEVYSIMTKKLRDNGINVITHIIIGLPNENIDDLLNTIRFVNDKTDGIKLQLLHVLKNTKLEEMYNKGLYKELSEEEYFYLLSAAINHLNKNIVIHRLTGDGPKKILIAPLWSANKKQVLADLNRYFSVHNTLQASSID